MNEFRIKGYDGYIVTKHEGKICVLKKDDRTPLKPLANYKRETYALYKNGVKKIISMWEILKLALGDDTHA